MYGAPRLMVFMAVTLGLMPVVTEAVDVGQSAPGLAVKLLNDQPFDLSAERGKIILLNFWATWCPPCRGEVPVLDAFYRENQDHGVEIIALSADRARDRAEVLKAAQAFAYPAAMLSDATTNDFGKPHVLPLTVVIDRSGTVIAVFNQRVTRDDLDTVVRPMLTP